MILTRKDYKYFDVAKAVSQTSDFHGTHIGSCLVYKGVVVSVGCNSEKTHPLQAIYNKFRNFDGYKCPSKIHAEVKAISAAMSVSNTIDWSKSSIYVYRELKNGKQVISKPCPACSSLIKKLGIANVYYIDENNNFRGGKVEDML